MNSPLNSGLYEFEGFVLDPLQRTVRTRADGSVLKLSARAFDALHLLVEHHGQLVEKEALFKLLWPKVVVEENNLTQIIHALRHSLGEKPGEHRFIATAPGRGYQFVAEVKQIPRTAVATEVSPDTIAMGNGAAASPRIPPTVPPEMTLASDVRPAATTSCAPTAGILVAAERNEGNRQFLQLLAPFTEQSLDLLQFTGYAATDLMHDVVHQYHGSTIRLLLASQANTSNYDMPGFHESNIKSTYQNLKIWNLGCLNATFAVWRYAVHPAISGAVVASRLASASWYRIYPVNHHELPVLRGQNQPTVTATAAAAPEIVRMVRAQFDSILYHRTTELVVAFGPKAAEVVDQWLSIITKDLSAEEKLQVTSREQQKIVSRWDDGELIQW